MIMTWIAGSVIGVIALLSLYLHVLPRSQALVTQGPTILTTLGIFGTFLGVAVGLYQFDSAAIEDSVPALLDGLRIAFWTSIAGLTGALSIKLRYAWKDLRRPQRESSGQTLGALIAAVEEQTGNSATQFEQLCAETRATRDVITQHQTHMIEANTEALSSAIRDIISEFNDRIDVQYGDNFRQLNASVGQLNAWQEAHQENVRSLVAELERATTQMSVATTSYEKLMHQTGSFSQVAEGMDSMLTGLNQQSEQLARYLESMSGMVRHAQEGLPDLEKRIYALTEGLADSLQAHDQTMTRLIDQTGRDWVAASDRMAQELSSGAQAVQEKIRTQAERALQQSDRQLAELEASLQEQLTRSLQTFGYQMTALSEKFVNDYQPLTERLQALVALTENLDTKAAKKSGRTDPGKRSV